MKAIIFIFLFISSSVFSQDTLREFKVAVGEWPPYITKENQNESKILTRFKADMKKAGYNVTFDFMPWKRALYSTRSGKYLATLPWSMNIDQRQDFYISSHPVNKMNKYIYFNRKLHPDGIKFRGSENVNDLLGVGILGYWYEYNLLTEANNLTLVTSHQSAWKMLQKGRVDYYLEDEAVAKYNIQTFFKGNWGDIGHQKADDQSSSGYVLFSKNSPMAYQAFLDYEKSAN